MMYKWITILSFLFFIGLVAGATILFMRKQDRSSEKGFFLAGRKLTFPFIAASLLLTNLSTEQMVGLNADAFSAGLSVMVWEVIAVIALVIMCLFFLPRFLKSGITTVPELLALRFDNTTRLICNFIFLIAYATILLPIILYTGAMGLTGILDMQAITGMQDLKTLIRYMVWGMGIIGSCYALLGGLSAMAFSDLLNGIGLLIGGFMITIFGLSLIGDGQMLNGISRLAAEIPERFNSIGGPHDPVPFGTIFSGVLVINLFYWCTNQQIIQRTLGAKDLAEGQKGVLLCGLLKLIGPLYLVLPGILAFFYFKHMGHNPNLHPVEAYGTLVLTVLPGWLSGFFCAVMTGAILSSFSSALNSTCTLFGLGFYKTLINKDASDAQVVRAGKCFGWIMALISMCTAPMLIGQKSIFTYLQTMNGIYFIPIFAVVLMGLLNHRVPSAAAKTGLIGGVIFITFCYFIMPDIVTRLGGQYHFLGVVFLGLLIVMYAWGVLAPQEQIWIQQYSGDVQLTPWRYAVPVSIALIVIVFVIYALFADFSVLNPS